MRVLGEGSIRGVLFDLGPYPAVIGGEGTVRGEVYAMVEPRRLLERVDAIEGFVAGDAARSEYRRHAAVATLDDGRRCPAWVYFYNRPLGEAVWVSTGDYRRHATRFRGCRPGPI